MIDMRFKPSWLPQVSMPFKHTLRSLKDNNVSCKMARMKPSDLKPFQGIVFGDKVLEIDSQNIKPIWVSEDNFILDGHHRYACALANEIPYVRVFKVGLNHMDAARMLNKIIDLYEYEEQRKIEEVVAQDQINALNDPDNDPANFLEMLAVELKEDKNSYKKKKKKLSAYRKHEIKEGSKVGNFFSTKPYDGYKKYDIEFDNLLDTNDMGLIFHGDNSPTTVLAKTWFPNVDFIKLAKKYNVKPDLLINRAICDAAKGMGFDGIKYGDIMIQGL